MICHHCDNRICVRPKHLFLGTAKDNAQDREKKGRGHQASGIITELTLTLKEFRVVKNTTSQSSLVKRFSQCENDIYAGG